jgi:AraC-like DNA-binding protein
VAEGQWFYRSDEEWKALVERLKLTACPHCKAFGTLNRHGFLYGYDDSCPPRKVVRARRLFCSNRNARRGCGRTVSVWPADKIRRLSVSTGTLYRFLQRAAGDGISEAIRVLRCHLSDRTLQRLWQRFNRSQSNIRTALSRCCPPPATQGQRPALHVLAHLHAAFPGATCPIAAFQHTLRTFFV